MWPWTKFRRYEEQIDCLRHEVALRDGKIEALEHKLKKLTDRDAKGRFKK